MTFSDETHAHIDRVRDLLHAVTEDLYARASRHDASKLRDPERARFAALGARDTPFNSPGYRRTLDGMGDALAHHYAANRHHPEHFEHGIADMSLLDLIEMLADWAAASERQPGGKLDRSIHANARRFSYGPDMTALLMNTAADLGWLNRPPGPSR